MRASSNPVLALVGLALVLLQVYVFTIPIWGDGNSPIVIFLPFAILYGLISRRLVLSFLVGFASAMSFPLGIAFWYWINASRLVLPTGIASFWMLAWATIAGAMGTLSASLTKLLTRK